MSTIPPSPGEQFPPAIKPITPADAALSEQATPPIRSGSGVMPQPQKAGSAPGVTAAGQPVRVKPVRTVTTPTGTGASRIIVESSKGRDAFVAMVAGLVLLVLIGIGVWALSRMPSQPSANKLTGKIIEKLDSGIREREITFGQKGLKEMETESGYTFKVQMPPPNERVYEVPVPKVQYERYQVGATYSFIRPRSEQR